MKWVIGESGSYGTHFELTGDDMEEFTNQYIQDMNEKTTEFKNDCKHFDSGQYISSG